MKISCQKIRRPKPKPKIEKLWRFLRCKTSEHLEFKLEKPIVILSKKELLIVHVTDYWQFTFPFCRPAFFERKMCNFFSSNHNRKMSWYYLKDVFFPENCIHFRHKLQSLIHCNLLKGIDKKTLKGQLISKARFKVFIWTKNRMKIFLYFCPSV